ncbi:MAG: 50S ribosomal protein L30 [Dehalococcoidia bacterium]|nr:50S ribosomal protein L30 [Dehalococcoidia bacterium]MDW8119293.1 50S ribosomal protein L30 [Chloroflexota bacterium]
MGKVLRITLVRSPIGSKAYHKKTLETLGLRRLSQSVLREDSPSLQGLLHTVRHLVRVEEMPEEPSAKPPNEMR